MHGVPQRVSPLRSYPRQFGVAIAQLAGAHLRPAEVPIEATTSHAECRATFQLLCSMGGDMWADAGLDEVVQYLLASTTLDVSWVV